MAAVTAVVAIAALWLAPRLQPATGTMVVVAAGRSATSLPTSSLMVGRDGSWSAVGDVSGAVPAAPDQRQLFEVALPAGTYQGVRLGDAVEPVTIVISAGHVEPLLLGVEDGKLIPGAAYAGNDDVNLGLGELAGKFVAMPAFALTDQAGRPFTLESIAGKDVVIAAFHTTCHETCPLYTALFLQLARQRSGSVELVEVTTDPGTDTPAVLAGYAKQLGATWTFATGTPDQLTAFWKPFGVDLASGDVHTSTLALLDRHGYVRLVYRGVPKVGNDIPPSLVSTLSATGLSELASGGDGWGAPDVLQALSTIGRGEPSPTAAPGKAPDFALASTDGTTLRSSELRGKALAINFWGTYCPPCRAELPMLATDVPRAGVRLVLINEGEGAGAVRAFLERAGVGQPSLLDTGLAVGRAYGMSALPMTVFVRSDGTIDRKQVGQLDERVLAAELSLLASQ